jgi:hypothetical protein
MASSSSTPPPPPEKDVDASETETLTFNVQNVDGKPCTSISAPGGVLVVSGECVAMNNMFGGLSITAIVDTAGTQIITIPGVCWTVGGSIPDGLVITGEAITTDGGKLKIETKISIKAPAAVGASVSKDVKVISEKFVVGVRLNGTFNSKIMSCWKREGDAILRIADQEFFHVSKLPVGGLNVLINTLRRQWGEHSNPTLVFRVQCDASYNSRATKTILNLLGFPIRDDLPGTKASASMSAESEPANGPTGGFLIYVIVFPAIASIAIVAGVVIYIRKRRTQSSLPQGVDYNRLN